MNAWDRNVKTDPRTLERAVRRTVRPRIWYVLAAVVLFAIAVFGIFAVTKDGNEDAGYCGYPVRVIGFSGPNYTLVVDYPNGTCMRYLYTPWPCHMYLYSVYWSNPCAGGGGGGSW